MHDKTKRPRGTGSLAVRTDAAGRDTWYGRFWVNGRLAKRRLGRKRPPGEKVGMTRSQAEAALRRLMLETAAAPPGQSERLSIEEAGKRYIRHLEAIGRKRSTIDDYRGTLRVHLAPFFGGRAMSAITRTDVEAFIATKQRASKAPKSIRNWLSLLHSVFVYA